MLRRQKYLAREKLAFHFANTFSAANLHRELQVLLGSGNFLILSHNSGDSLPLKI